MPVMMMVFSIESQWVVYLLYCFQYLGNFERKMLPKIKDPDAYLEQLAEARRSKKRKPGFMQRMMAMAEETQRGQASSEQ